MGEAALEEEIRRTVTNLLNALQEGDVQGYRALMTPSDRQYMSEEALAENMRAMEASMGRLIRFQVEGVVLHPEARHAAVHVSLDFANLPTRTELYHLTADTGEWLLDFDFAELLGHGF